MTDLSRIKVVMGKRYLEFRCAVIEIGTRCNNRHLEPVGNRQEVEDIADCGHICETCEKKGYAWYTRLLGHVDENGELASSLATDPTGAKNSEFRTGSTDIVRRNGADVAQGFKVDGTQKAKGEKGSRSLKGWGAVREYPEYGDILMLRSDEAKDAGSPMLERKQRTVVGLANAPKIEDPFEGKF